MHTGSKLIAADSLDLNCIEYAEMHTADKQSDAGTLKCHGVLI